MKTTASEFAEITAKVFVAWLRFKNFHKLESAKMSCCEITREFYAAMESFERSVDEMRETEQ